ncbi:hypothetical protein OS493_037828 [Desmophyllum pertusum]|uniref:Uncharacterized protein n=1 Tax=Desmophyllum pertusum TaxID=174260 RepID=A0A9X0CWG9_9CNID|nr:hypothetical protein OS493_037828 [Desmophyllum pertusum]
MLSDVELQNNSTFPPYIRWQLTHSALKGVATTPSSSSSLLIDPIGTNSTQHGSQCCNQQQMNQDEQREMPVEESGLTELERLQDEVKEKEERVKKLIAQLNCVCKISLDEVKEKDKNIEKVTSELNVLQDELKEQKDSVKKLTFELTLFQHNCKILRDEVKENKETIKKRNSKLNSLQQKYKILQDEAKENKETVKNITSEITYSNTIVKYSEMKLRKKEKKSRNLLLS